MVRPIGASNWNQAATQRSPAGGKTADSCFELILPDCYEKPHNDFLDCFVITFLAMTSSRAHEESATAISAKTSSRTNVKRSNTTGFAQVSDPIIF